MPPRTVEEKTNTGYIWCSVSNPRVKYDLCPFLRGREKNGGFQHWIYKEIKLYSNQGQIYLWDSKQTSNFNKSRMWCYVVRFQNTHFQGSIINQYSKHGSSRSPSKLEIIYKTTRHHIPEDHNFNYENPKYMGQWRYNSTYSSPRH